MKRRLKPLALCLALLLAAPLVYAPLTPKAEAFDVVKDEVLIKLTTDYWNNMLRKMNIADLQPYIGGGAIDNIVRILNVYLDEQRIKDYKKNYPDFIAASAAKNYLESGYKIEETDPQTKKTRINIDEYQRYRNDLLKNTKQRLQDAMLMQEAEAQARNADLVELDMWRARSASAVGAVEAMQINSQIVALQTKIQLRQQALEAMANKAQAAATLNQMQADELASVTMNRQIVVDSAQWKERGAPGGKPLALTGILALLFGKTSPIEYRVESHL